MRVATALLVLALAGATARADDSVSVVVSGGGDLQAKVEDHLETWLERHGYTRAESDLSDDAITTLTNCLVIDDEKCASAVIDARAHHKQLLFVRIDVARPATAVTFTTYWFVKGKDATGQRRTCDACTGDAWQPVTDAALGELNGAVAKKTGDTSHLAEREPPPRPPPVRRVRLRAREQPEEPGSHVLPGLMLGAGVASLAGSGVLFYYGAKGGPSEKYTYPDAAAWGIGLAVVGAGATLGGIMLWKQASETSAPVAAITPHGSYFGWITHF